MICLHLDKPSHILYHGYYFLVDTCFIPRFPGPRILAIETFKKLWRILTPNIVTAKPMSDLCGVCQRNMISVYRSANLPDSVKSERVKAHEEHLSWAHEEVSPEAN